MAVDWWILRTQKEPVLRFYRWSKPTVSLGYRQQNNPPDQLESFFDRNVSVVVRPSGGGFLYHEGDLSYSVYVPADHPLASSGVRESYRQICEPILRSALDLDLLDETEWGTGDEDTANCLRSPAQHEPVHEGSKWQAAAQVRRQRALLQQGSIFWDEEWSDDISGTRPYFLEENESGTTRSTFRDRIIEKLREELFADRTGHFLHLSSESREAIEKSRSSFRVSSRSELPTFHRFNGQ
jgi:lipoate-protein ligase A